MEKIKIAAIQMPTVADKMENVRTVKAYLLLPHSLTANF